MFKDLKISNRLTIKKMVKHLRTRQNFSELLITKFDNKILFLLFFLFAFIIYNNII